MRALSSLALLALLVLAARPARADDVDQALRALAGPAPLGRAEAAASLARIDAPSRSDRILVALATALEDPVVVVRRAAALALAARGDRRAVGALSLRLETEDDPRALAALLLAVGDLGDRRHVPVVVDRVETSALASVRAAGATALGRLGGARAREVLLRLVETPGAPDPDWSLRAAATLALARVGQPDDVPAVLRTFEAGGGERSWFARSAIARLVAALDRHPVPVLTRLAADEDPRVAVTATTGLARSGHADVLLGLLRSGTPSVRVAAAGGAGQAAVAAAAPRLRLLAHLDPAREVRWAAALALFRLEDPEGDRLVLEALGAREPAVWTEAVARLVERTGERHGRDPDAWRAALRRWRAGR